MPDSSWGAGYPHCQTSKIEPFIYSSLRGREVHFPAHYVDDFGNYHERVDLPAGIRPELQPLAFALIRESERRGYINLEPHWCWGFACRGIKSPSGGTSYIPSYHSFGIALDLNAPENPFGGSNHSIPTAMGLFWGDWGFRWGGFYSGTRDWMHFEFMRSVSDAKVLGGRAQAQFGEQEDELTPEEKQLIDYIRGFKKFHDKGPEPKEAGPSKQGWQDAKKGVESPKGN